MFTSRFQQQLKSASLFLPLEQVIDVTIRFPISVRKIVINCCQEGVVEGNPFIGVDIPLKAGQCSGDRILKKDFVANLRSVVSDNIQASILWIIARSCAEPIDNDEHEAVAQEGFEKEISASQTIFNDVQTVSYSSFFRDKPGHNDPGLWWIQTCREIRDGIHRRLHLKCLYPSVNRVKNVSDETASIFRILSDTEYVRTVDLELFHHRTGIKVGGDAELRQAWKFNDLKPRMYYCIGGEQYWSCRYMKGVAVAIMESIPSTFMKKRTSPHDFIRMYNKSDHITTWDFTSFTTTLSELKHFLWYIARIVEEEGTTVELFDYRIGFHTTLLFHLIDEYNQVANMSAGFGIHRMVGEFISTTHVNLHQFNSGMLGVHGNIGFSTALHGLVLAKEVGNKNGVCVGDDALGITHRSPFDRLFSQLSTIGVVHPTKFGILFPECTQDTGHHIKFLKRRLEVVGTYLVLSRLFDFVLPPYVDGEVGFRTPPVNFELRDRVFKIATAAGSLLSDLYEDSHLIDDKSSISLVFLYLRTAYRYLSLPFCGILPGYTLFRGSPDEFTVDGFVLPDISEIFDPTTEDWLERLLSQTSFDYYRAPVQTRMLAEDSFFMTEGEECYCNETAWIRCMVDLEKLETTKVMEWRSLRGEGSKRELERFVKGVKEDGFDDMVHVRCLNDIPVVFCRPIPRGVEERLDDTMEI